MKNKLKPDSANQDSLAGYEKQTSRLTHYTERIEALIRDFFEAENVRVLSVTSRVKETASLADKLLRLDKTYDSINDVTDICGVRVITYYSDEVDRIAKIIRREFLVDPRNSVDKRLPISPDRFGYSSLHYVVSLKPKHARLTENKIFRGLKCEIQIRSVLQHAWAEIEHDLGYKSKVAVPDDIRRRFARLASLFELGDDEFVEVRREVRKHKAEVERLVRKFPEHAKLDEEALHAFARFDPIVLALDREVAQMLGARLETKNPWTGCRAEVLRYFGMKTIKDVRQRLKKNFSPFRRFCRAIGADSHPGALPAGITLLYLGHFLGTEGNSYRRALAYINRFRFMGRPTKSALARHFVRLRRQTA